MKISFDKVVRFVSFAAPIGLLLMSIYYGNVLAAIASLVLFYVIRIHDIAASIADEMHMMNHFIIDVISDEFDDEDMDEFEDIEDRTDEESPQEKPKPVKSKTMLDDADETTWEKLMQSIKKKDEDGR
jgi:hypothetical protein